MGAAQHQFHVKNRVRPACLLTGRTSLLHAISNHYSGITPWWSGMIWRAELTLNRITLMTTFHLLLNPGERLDVEHAVQLLKEQFPLTIVEGDTFERKWRQLANNFAALSDQGNTIRNPDLLRRNLARSEAETGPGMDVSTSVDEAIKVTGSIMSGGISLSSYDPLRPDMVKKLEEYLLCFKIGRVVTATK